ncbi:uncharacterized protein [Thunnus thynnus]|uniref:uncharacterized protein n=1 Tax=Thunnus thynnus TaxID=8237 RepID=UPI0035285A29
MQENMKKKKQRPPKRNKDHKKAFRSNRPEFESFLDEMIGWFSDHQEQVDERFSPSDADRSGSVNLNHFQFGLMDLGVPCQQYQLHMLTQLLKTADNMISYQNLSGQVQRLRLRDDTELEDFMKRRGAAEKEDVSCLDQRVHRHLRLSNPEKDRFLRLSVRLIPFDSAAAHPGNFEVVLASSSKVFSLIRIIRERVGIQSSRLEVFRSRVSTEEVRLPPESSLEECGFEGGPEETPPETAVFYDYKLPFTDCPVLNCDHYFRAKPDSAGRTVSKLHD